MTVLAILLVKLSAVWLIFCGIYMALRPRHCLHILSKMGSTTFINFAEHIPRFTAGLAIYFAADVSKAPLALKIIGGFIALSSIAILIAPRRWHHAYALYWSKRIPVWAVRVLASLPILAGSGLFWVLSAKLSFQL